MVSNAFSFMTTKKVVLRKSKPVVLTTIGLSMLNLQIPWI